MTLEDYALQANEPAPAQTAPAQTKEMRAAAPTRATGNRPAQIRLGEFWAWAAFLALCLAVGLAVGGQVAPKPLIGLVRFDATIDLGTAAQLVDVLEAARQDNRIAGVVIEVSSPGGLATSSESIFYSMLKLRAQKPVVVEIDGLAVSGGYYMAAAANRIYAPASAYVGNVGTRGPRPSDPALAPEEMSSGPYKLTGGSRFDRVHQLDLVKQAFVSNVVHQRQNAQSNPLKIDAGTVAEARIYLGSEAVAVGLTDFEGSRSDAILGAAELAGIRRYSVANLADLYHVTIGTGASANFQASVKSMVETAPPDAVFLLDSRIPLPGLEENSAVEQHMLKLREMAPASLNDLPALNQLPGQAPGSAPRPQAEPSATPSGEGS